MGGSVVEFSPATREARVRFPAHAESSPFWSSCTHCPSPQCPGCTATADYHKPSHPQPTQQPKPSPLSSTQTPSPALTIALLQLPYHSTSSKLLTYSPAHVHTVAASILSYNFLITPPRARHSHPTPPASHSTVPSTHSLALPQSTLTW